MIFTKRFYQILKPLLVHKRTFLERISGILVHLNPCPKVYVMYVQSMMLIRFFVSLNLNKTKKKSIVLRNIVLRSSVYYILQSLKRYKNLLGNDH